MADDINDLLKNLKFSEEKSVRVISSNIVYDYQGFEAWAVGKIITMEKPNREAICRVLRSLRFTKYEVNFMALNEEVILIKFRYVEHRNRILNLMPYLFDNCLFAMLPFIKDKELETYEFNISPFWIRIYNILLEYMDRKITMEVGKVIGEFVAIDWKDKNGGIIGHTIQKCKKNEEVSDSNNLGLQYGNWLRALPMNPNQNRGIWRNGIEMVSTQSITNDTIEESKLDTREEDTKNAQKGKGKKYVEDSMSNSPMEKRITKSACDRPGRFKCKRKRQKSIPGDNTNESPSKIAWRRLVDNMSPSCSAYPYIDTKVIRQSSSDHDAIMLDTLGKKPKEK
ncbi:hypothetical protein GOBAR_AA24607 [Gossypium barbadense]|uniref:Uncharacterized protein n=1 Tax=Gossypium barbadense TaxID=3634 RepID=A0A2P5WYA3_GOSBA|nr:hypothetical protein GOBAR_AA24607 [Gossypium barbadense]